MNGKALTKKGKSAVLGVLLVYAVTVATNLGEFWPFSIYPMFSQAGNPWNRALVREIPPEDSIRWEPSSLNDLPGLDYGVSSNNVDAIDLANFVSKTEVWNEQRVGALSMMLLAGKEEALRLQVFKVRAHLTEDDSVAIVATPYVVVGTELEPSVLNVNPEIRP